VGVMAERAVKFVIAASIALVLMSLQGWWTSDVYGTIHGLHADGLTGIGDGVLISLGSVAAGALAFAALVRPVIRHWAGRAIGLLGSVMLIVTMYDILFLPSTPARRLLSEPGPGLYHATPLLYFAAFTSFLIGLAGLTMALAPRDRTGHEQIDKGRTAWA
jgi:hypothetical protein